MKKKIGVCMLGAMLLLSACGAGVGSNGGKLSDDFNEAEVIKQAKIVIDYVHADEFQTLEEKMWGTVMKENAPAEKLQDSVKPILEELGQFESYEKEVVTGEKDKDTEQEFAVAVILVKYENRKAQYTISFDNNMKVIGFFIK